MRYTLPIIIILCFANPANTYSQQSRSDSLFVVSLDPPIHQGNSLVQKVNYRSPITSKATIRVRSLLMNGTDSNLLYDLVFKDITISEGLGNVSLDFNKNSTVNQADYKFQEIIKRFEVLPPGEYVTYVDLLSIDKSLLFAEKFKWYIDSMLSPFSPLKKDVNKTLSVGSTKMFARSVQPEPLSATQASNLNGKIDKKVARKNGVITRPYNINGERQTGFYYKGWFLGYYKLLPTPDLKERINRENTLLKNNPLELVTSDLEGFTSLSSQTRKANKKENKNEVTGSIGLLSNFSTGQETGSQQDRNFQEVYGNFNTEIMKVPVVVEGYYTTQDNKRTAKASYLRIRYDAEKNKSELTKAAGDFTGKHELAQSRGVGYKAVFEEMIKGLISQQSVDKALFENEFGINSDLLRKYNGDWNKMISELDTSALLEKGLDSTGSDDISATKAKLENNRQKLQEQYQKIKQTQEKIEKYRILLDQYDKQQYFDSAMSYTKLKELNGTTDASPKQLAKAAEHILPEGRSSSFLNSLTRLEFGILNSYESDYTMSGQVLKGGSLGYDLGGVIVSGAMGKTEYISRDGNVDRYNTTMIRADLHPTLNRKLGLVYYTCSATKQMVSDNDFFKGDAGIPSFRKPTNVLSLPYEFTIAKNLSLMGEAAVSYRKFDDFEKTGNHNTAYKTGLLYTIPVVHVALNAEWEHIGRNFENAAMPFPKAATDRYTIGSQGTFYKGFVTAGIQFNYLKQETFVSSGKNIKWGFDIRTHSKRYPEIYLSYKPFSTFRSYDDTLAIAQRPMIGSVSVGRISYQLRNKELSHRFMLTYNRNNSIQEDIAYNSTTLQGTYMFSGLMDIISFSLGWMEQPQFIPGAAGNVSSYFGNISYTRKITDALTVNAGQDLAVANYGIQRSATTFGTSYMFKNKPLNIRLSGRYNSFRANEVTTKENLWSCMLGCNWLIRPQQKNDKIKK